MSKEVEKVSLALSKITEDHLLELLSAKKGDIKTREDLKNYSFKCSCCKEVKPAAEAVMLQTMPKLNFTNLKKSVRVEVSSKAALICQECQIKHWKAEGQE